MFLSRDPGVFFVLLYFCTHGLRPLTSWRFAHTRPRGNQRLFPLGTPSRPATFSLFTKQQLRKVAMGSDLTLTYICRLLRPYSKMLSLPIGHPWPTKASLTSCQAHAIFFNGLKCKAEFRLFQSRNLNHLWTKVSQGLGLNLNRGINKSMIICHIVTLCITANIVRHFYQNL